MKLQSFADYTFVDGGVCAAAGFKANGVCCGLRHQELSSVTEQAQAANEPDDKPKKNDLAMIVSDCDCAAAAVYTSNQFKGAPILVTKKHLADGRARAVIVNSVNANTCNADGVEKAEAMCRLAADALHIPAEDVVVASTGVIGQVLPIEPIAAAVPALAEGLSYEGNEEAVHAIMTTDTREKEVAVSFRIGKTTCTLGGMLKGSGMIHPNMATTLTFLTTDCAISPAMLQQALSDVVRVTLNRVSVDGDQSTNDMVCVMANGMAENKEISDESKDYAVFRGALYTVMLNLARMCAADGEGATKLIECVVSEAASEETAEKLAKSVICSSLFKAAMFGADANWGRIACAMGYADCDFDISKVDVDLASAKGRISVAKDGFGVPFSEEDAKTILLEDEIQVLISLKAGAASAVAWGCDLTYDYVKINGDYRS
ncbi:MAG: bifunctional glutamate N-acetyltransferase/amino-acid acetyltransferase ArgJ [Oscillospiraceae bacterium]|nr:bifunctional glutamate N-acetyltransferase/amino-acid acetyltransferase ArgJ [Oscillospiraceae bacterium]MCR4761866.1 bifunctional glutamate N-acetyltransferase/amino-acid acetyltransferase ArgJ [Oscillospiraceae bacterium]